MTARAKRVGVILGDPETQLQMIESNVDMRLLLQEILTVLESGADFQLGPEGRHRDLPTRMRALISGKAA